MGKRFVILSGPAGVGKGPLQAAVKEFYKEIVYDTIPVIKAKESRPDGPRNEKEKEQWDNPEYWRTSREIRALESDPRYIIGDCRGLPQAINQDKVKESTSDTKGYKKMRALKFKLARI
ncbi:hypothetical protein ACFLZ8_04760 [Planctomycetota bacterium]